MPEDTRGENRERGEILAHLIVIREDVADMKKALTVIGERCVHHALGIQSAKGMAQTALRLSYVMLGALLAGALGTVGYLMLR